MGCTGSKGSRELQEFQNECLNGHNNYRSQHKAPSMKLNKQLCRMAQNYAKTLASKKKLQHASQKDRKISRGTVGENLAMTGHSDPTQMHSASHFVNIWYNESRSYNFNRQGFNTNTGHFTQVVWKGSKELGIGMAKYKEGRLHKTVVVGRYYPAGNVMGGFEKNVFPK